MWRHLYIYIYLRGVRDTVLVIFGGKIRSCKLFSPQSCLENNCLFLMFLFVDYVVHTSVAEEIKKHGTTWKEIKKVLEKRRFGLMFYLEQRELSKYTVCFLS